MRKRSVRTFLFFSTICELRKKSFCFEFTTDDNNLFILQTLQVLWSGGIDTTAVVVALREALRKHSVAKKYIYIRYCESSCLEYPWFYRNWILKGPWSLLPIKQHVRDIFSGNSSCQHVM